MECSPEGYKLPCLSLFPGMGRGWEEGDPFIISTSGEEPAHLLLVKLFYSPYTDNYFRNDLSTYPDKKELECMSDYQNPETKAWQKQR